MIEKHKMPISTIFVALIPILILFYYISGIFLFPDLTIYNITEKLELVFREFYKPWVWYNEKTLPCLGMGIIVWVLFASYVLYHFRNFQHGKEFGAEEWADPKEVTKRHCAANMHENRILSRDVRVAKEGKGALTNNNMVVIGISGGYKTTSVVTTNLLQADVNYIVLDVKGELMYKYGLYLKEMGYTIRCLNMKYPNESDRYNPFEYIESEEDIIRLISNIYDSLTPPDSLVNDPFWTEGPLLYLQSVFYYEWDMAKKEKRKGCINNILKYINEELIQDTSAEPDENEKLPSLLQSRMKRLEKEEGMFHPAARDYRKFKEGASETVRSITIIVNAKLKLFETKGLQRIFSDDDINLREFGTGVGSTIENPSGRKIALFLCADDMDKSFHFVFSMLYTQATIILSRMADKDFKHLEGKLPIALEMWMDEFYAGARPHATDELMGVIRSRNISMIPILQSVAQIKACFKESQWQIIMDNSSVLLFLGAGPGASETHEYISNLIGKMTIEATSDGKNGVMQHNVNYSKQGRELMSPAEVRRMPLKDCIILMQGEFPIYDKKALPWEMPEKIVPFQEAVKLNKKNPDGGYVHREHYVVEDRETGELVTLTQAKAPDIIRRVEEIPKGAKTICYTEEEFLNLNLTKETKEVKKQKYKEAYHASISSGKENAKNVKMVMESLLDTSLSETKNIVPNFGTSEKTEDKSRKERNISGTLTECFVRYGEEMQPEEIQLILLAMKQAVYENDVKLMFTMTEEEMKAFVTKQYGTSSF